MSATGQANGDGRRDMLAKQLEALGDEPHFAAAEDAAPQVVTTEVSTEPPTDRARDEAGKFVAKDIKTVKVTEPELPLEGSPTTQAAPVVEPPLWERPPASWKPEFREPWKTVDPKVREYFWKREEEMSAGVLPLKEKAKLADQINEVAAPYMNTIRGMGIDLPKAVQGLMYADNVLRTAPHDQKRDYLLQLAQTYGIQLGDVGGHRQPAVDPNLQALYAELNTVRGEVKSWQQQQEESQRAAQLSEINRFALKAEFFEEVRPTMVRLLESGVAEDIEDAYKKALRLDENLSERASQRTQALETTTQSAAADKAAKAAKAAAVSVKTSTPGVSTITKAQDRRALLEEQFSSSEARV